MNWLTNFIPPRLKALVARKEAPENLWLKCPSCEQMLFHRDLEANQQVCNHCNHHLRVRPLQRLPHLFDGGKHEVHAVPKPIVDRLKEAQSQAGAGGDAIVVASGEMEGQPAVVAIFDFGFMGGSMGMAVGEGVVTASRIAVQKKAPLILFSASGGARMQEGVLSLMQMPRTTIAVREVKEAGLPYIVVLTDPTTGGVTASLAMLGDIHIAEPGSLIGFSGQRVTQGAMRETLPPGFQRAEYQYEHGMVDLVVHRHELRATLARIVSILLKRPAVEAA